MEALERSADPILFNIHLLPKCLLEAILDCIHSKERFQLIKSCKYFRHYVLHSGAFEKRLDKVKIVIEFPEFLGRRKRSQVKRLVINEEIVLGARDYGCGYWWHYPSNCFFDTQKQDLLLRNVTFIRKIEIESREIEEDSDVWNEDFDESSDTDLHDYDDEMSPENEFKEVLLSLKFLGRIHSLERLIFNVEDQHADIVQEVFQPKVSGNFKFISVKGKSKLGVSFLQKLAHQLSDCRELSLHGCNVREFLKHFPKTTNIKIFSFFFNWTYLIDDCEDGFRKCGKLSLFEFPTVIFRNWLISIIKWKKKFNHIENLEHLDPDDSDRKLIYEHLLKVVPNYAPNWTHDEVDEERYYRELIDNRIKCLYLVTNNQHAGILLMKYFPVDKTTDD